MTICMRRYEPGICRVNLGMSCRLWRSTQGRLTGDAHSKAKVNRIPDHWPVCNRQQGLGVLIGVRCESRERRAGSAQDQGLKPRRGHRHSVRHPCGGMEGLHHVVYGDEGRGTNALLRRRGMKSKLAGRLVASSVDSCGLSRRSGAVIPEVELPVR